jgi:hypothetical protein
MISEKKADSNLVLNKYNRVPLDTDSDIWSEKKIIKFLDADPDFLSKKKLIFIM